MAERKKPLPYLRWFVTDYRASRNANRLTWQERGLYRELLDECWIEGSIPDDLPRLAEHRRCPSWSLNSSWQGWDRHSYSDRVTPDCWWYCQS
jgi:hypothetical protein